LKDIYKTKKQLINELVELCQKISELEKSKAECRQVEETLMAARVIAEEERAKSESIIETIGDAISIQDTNFRILYQNQVHKNLTGDHIGDYCYIAYKRSDHICEGCPVDMSFRNGDIHTKETSTTIDGEVSYVEITTSPLKDKTGKIIAGIEVVRDITRRKRMEKELKASALKWQTTFDAICDAISLLDKEGKILQCNKVITNISGKPFSEITGRTCWEVMHGTSEPIEGCPLVRMWKSRRRETLVLPIGDRWFDVSVDPILDEYGGLIGAVHIMSDITDRIRLEKKIHNITTIERQRIGQDLHDDLCQHLTGIAFLSKVLEQRLSGKSLPEASDAATIVKLINEATDKTRNLARGLCPVGIGTDSFVSALQALVSKTETVFDISCLLEIDKPIQIYDNNVAMHLYYIVQEAITNAITHGKAKHVLINITSVDEKVTLTVKDDGVGFQEVLREDIGMGLHIMAYRAQQIDALFDVRGDACGWTIVSCSFQNVVDRDKA